jgi:prefoldin subunit 5
LLIRVICGSYSLSFFDFFDFEVKYSSSGLQTVIHSLKDVKTIGESVQIFDTLVPINENTFAVANVDEKKDALAS